MSITINLDIGQEATIRSKLTPEGFTHDWEVYVRGVNNADISHYVDRVVFHLHETFPKPKRVVKDPPYSIKTSGYAGFNMPVEIYLKNSQDPRKLKFSYDLVLQQTGPTYKVQREKYVFSTVTDEFKAKLLKGGGILGGFNQTPDDLRGAASNLDDKNQMTSKPKLTTSVIDQQLLKKPKFRPDVDRDSFQNLFGPPITKTKPELPKVKEVVPKNVSTSKSDGSKGDKNKTKSPHKDKTKDKPPDEKKLKDEKKVKDKTKERDHSREKSSKKDRDKSPSSYNRGRSSSPKHSGSKEKEIPKEKDRDRKIKKEKREHKENKHRDGGTNNSHKEHKLKPPPPISREPVQKDVSPAPPVVPQINPPPPQQSKTEKKEKSKDVMKDEEKSKHKHKKKDKDRNKEKKEERSHKNSDKNASVKENGKDATGGSILPPVPNDKSNNLFGSPKSDPPPPEITPPKKEIKQQLILSNLVDEESSNSSREASPVKFHEVKKREKKERKREKKGEKEMEKKRKRKLEEDILDGPPAAKKEVVNNSDDERKVSSSEDVGVVNNITVAAPAGKNETEDYMGTLRDLQHKIMCLRDNSDLQKVVQLIAETGRYEVSAHTFDFDLCLLDRSTVKQLQEFFATISS